MYRSVGLSIRHRKGHQQWQRLSILNPAIRSARLRSDVAAMAPRYNRPSRNPYELPTRSAIRLKAQRHHPRWRRRHSAVSGDAGCLEAVAADLRQADDLLSTGDSDAGGRARHLGDLHAAGYPAIS